MIYANSQAQAESPASPNVSSIRNFDEIARLASETFQIARSFCRSCRSYHTIWPYLRLTGRQRGVEADWAILEPLLGQMIAGGARRILLAGSADPGLLSLVLAAAGSHQVAVTVVDICETPLAMCRLLAERRGIPIQTVAGCLSKTAFEGDQDIILAHSVLSFIAPSLVPVVVAGFRRALAPGGRLVLSAGLSTDKPQLDQAVFCSNVLSALEARGVSLPTNETEFRMLLVDYVEGRRQRRNPFGGLDDVAALFAAHQITIEKLIHKARGTSTIAGRLVERSKPGVVLVAGRL